MVSQQFIFLILFTLNFSNITYASEWGLAANRLKAKNHKELNILPEKISKYLTKEKCNIPTGAVGSNTPSALATIKGWTKGSFAKKGQIDWVIICVKKKHSFLKVFWGGEKRCKDHVNFKVKISNNLYGGSSYPNTNFFYYSRDVSAKKTRLLDALVESNDKGAEIYKCENGNWIVTSSYH